MLGTGEVPRILDAIGAADSGVDAREPERVPLTSFRVVGFRGQRSGRVTRR